MQGHWTMRFQGEKESIQKLTATLENKKDEWFGCAPDFTWKREDDVLFQSNSSANINGMSEEFQELVKTFPELEAAYCESQLDPNWNTQHVYYSKAGDKGTEDCMASYEYDEEEVLHINDEDGDKDAVEAFIDDNGFSRENAEKVVALFKYRRYYEGEKPEPFTFDYKNCEDDLQRFDSEKGDFFCVCDYDYTPNDGLGTRDGESWVWVSHDVIGYWWFWLKGANQTFIEELLEAAH